MKQINTTVARTLGGLLTLDGVAATRPLHDALTSSSFEPGDRVSIVLTDHLPGHLIHDEVPALPAPFSWWIAERSGMGSVRVLARDIAGARREAVATAFKNSAPDDISIQPLGSVSAATPADPNHYSFPLPAKGQRWRTQFRVADDKWATEESPPRTVFDTNDCLVFFDRKGGGYAFDRFTDRGVGNQRFICVGL